jgi:hypothetical protein
MNPVIPTNKSAVILARIKDKTKSEPSQNQAKTKSEL